MSYDAPDINPYDQQTIDYDSATPPFDEIIRQGILGHQLLLRVMLPAMIVKVVSEQTADVQPMFQTRMADGTLKNLSIIHNVPVSMIMGDDYYIKVPIAVGDTGYILCADRSMDAWLASQGDQIVDPADTKQHDLEDAMFVPGLVPTANQTEDGTTDLVTSNGEAVHRIRKDGSFQFTGPVVNVTFDKDGNYTFVAGDVSATFASDGTYTFTNGTMVAQFTADGKFKFSNGTNELLDLLVQITTEVQSLSSTLSTDTVNTIFGPTKLNAFATYENIANVLEDLLNKLTTLKE